MSFPGLEGGDGRPVGGVVEEDGSSSGCAEASSSLDGEGAGNGEDDDVEDCEVGSAAFPRGTGFGRCLGGSVPSSALIVASEFAQ